MLMPASIRAKPLEVPPRSGPVVRQRGAYSRIGTSFNLCVAASRCRGVCSWRVQRRRDVTRDKDRKRIIRGRMKKTGESYTSARAHIISQPRVKQPAVAPAAAAGMTDAAIAAKTGRTWRDWMRVLDADGAAAMSHRNIAALVHEKHGVGDWWAQTVTVGYERIKGLRDRGQRRDGAYEAGKSRTFAVPVNTLFDAWADKARRRRWLAGVEPDVRTATAPKSIRLQWPDGTIVVVGFTPKGDKKSAVAVVHTKLRDRTAADRAKGDWKDRLDALASMLAGS
jgi:hypothetical protein